MIIYVVSENKRKGINLERSDSFEAKIAKTCKEGVLQGQLIIKTKHENFTLYYDDYNECFDVLDDIMNAFNNGVKVYTIYK